MFILSSSFLSPQSCKFQLRAVESRKAHTQYCNNSLCNTTVDALHERHCLTVALEPLSIYMQDLAGAAWGSTEPSPLPACTTKSSGSAGSAPGRVTAPSSERGELCHPPTSASPMGTRAGCGQQRSRCTR